jgi:hypothetical protein
VICSGVDSILASTLPPAYRITPRVEPLSLAFHSLCQSASVRTPANGGGIDIFGTLTVRDSLFASNVAFDGGGFANEGCGTLTMIGSFLTGNSAQRDGGGLANSGILKVSYSIFGANSASLGGGIYDLRTLTVTDSAFFNNTGGDIYE